MKREVKTIMVSALARVFLAEGAAKESEEALANGNRGLYGDSG